MVRKYPGFMTDRLGREISHGPMTWIQVHEWRGDEFGGKREMAVCYVPRWALFNPVRVSSNPTLFERREIWEKRCIAIHVYTDAAMTGELQCELLTYGGNYPSDADEGEIQGQSKYLRELMDLAINQYPGFTIGLPRANAFLKAVLVLIKGLFKPAMWGFWLALLALAWNGYNEWFR